MRKYYSEMQGEYIKYEARFPRVYTSDNSPIAVCGNGDNISTKLIQDNDSIDIKDYDIKIKRAKGSIDEKLVGQKSDGSPENTVKLDKPITYEFNDGTMQFNGNGVEIGPHEWLQTINRNSLEHYELEIQLPDGRRSEFTYGMNNHYKPSQRSFMESIDKIIYTGGIDPREIRIIAKTGNQWNGFFFPKAEPKQVEIIDDQKGSTVYGKMRGRIEDIERVLSEQSEQR